MKRLFKWLAIVLGGSLLEVLDETVTPMGSRQVGRWLRQPLKDVAAIEARLDSVQFFKDQGLLRQRWRAGLKGLGDLERLTARLALGQATPREAGAVRQALARLPGLKEMLTGELPRLAAEAAEELEDLSDLHELLASALVDDPPPALAAGGVIRQGYDQELDELFLLSRGGKEWIARLEETGCAGAN